MVFVEDKGLADLRAILALHGYVAVPARPEMYDLFAANLRASDKYEATRTPFGDWRVGLRAALAAPGAYCVQASGGRAAALFGVSPHCTEVAQIWMVATDPFMPEAFARFGPRAAIKMTYVTRAIVSLYRKRHPTVFNFIPDRQTQTIRWLRQAGFEFYRHPSRVTDMLFFAQGPKGRALSQDTNLWLSSVGRSL
jgi:hypothetical protein